MNRLEWIEPIQAAVERTEGASGVIVILPDYRPDQCLALATHLDLPEFDFRAETMSQYGWGADQVSLDELTSTLRERAMSGGAVVTNVDALLATKSADECMAWLAKFLETKWPSTLVVPIVVHAPLVPKEHERCHWVPSGELPQQTFINRLVY